MKKTTKLFAGIAVLAAISTGAALAGCAGADNGNKVADLTTTEEVYGFSAATAGMVISGMNEGSAAALAQSAQAASARTGGQVTDEETIASLNEYMMLVESLISDGNFEIVSGENDNADYAQYEFKMTASYYDLNGNKLQYESYYNQTLKGTHTERDDDMFDDEEVTSVYIIEGVMLIDGTAHAMEGRFVNETEGRESENTHTLRVALDTQADDYLLVTQESENEDGESETEYVYSTYRGGKLAERTTFEYENERDETEITMTISDRVNGTNRTFEFEKETERGREIIKLTVGGNGGAQSYIVRIEQDENGNSQYVYYSGDKAVGRGERHGYED